MERITILKKSILLAIVLLMCAAGSVNAVYASGTSDTVPDLPGGSYSLDLTVQSTNPDGSVTKIKGAKISVFRVAGLTVKHGAAYYKTLTAFEELKVSFENMTAEESNRVAEKFAGVIDKKDISGETGVSGSNGRVRFADLEPGVYLVRLDGYDSSDSGYTAMDPFLVLVPGIDRTGSSNKWLTDVRAVPKLVIRPADTAEVDYSVIKKIEGKSDADETFTFELRADDIMNPVPAGSVRGIKRISIKGAGTAGFGTWEYTEPGSYSYTVREIAGSNRNYSYDSTVYHMTDKVYYSGSKLCVAHRATDENGHEYQTSGFVFVNQYISTGPKTGDEVRYIFLLICAAALAGCVAAVSRRRGWKR